MSLPIPKLPNPIGAYTLSAGGFSVTLPQTVSSGEEPIAGGVYFEELPGRDGLFTTRNPVLLGRSLTLSGYVDSVSTVRSLRQVLGQKRLTVTRGDRGLLAEVVDISIVERVYGKLWFTSITLESPNYYWTGDTVTTASSPGSVVNNGDLPVYPTFTVTAGVGGLASINFEVDGRQVEWTGNLPEGGILIIDCEGLTTTAGGVNDLNGMNSSFFVNPVRLEATTNTLTTTINGAATFTVKHTERFL